MGTAEAGFDYLLDRLPFNGHRLSTDASTSFGMSGVLRFSKSRTLNNVEMDGLFWQINWQDWRQIVSTKTISVD